MKVLKQIRFGPVAVPLLIVSIVITLYLSVFAYANPEPGKTPTGWYWPAGSGETGGYLAFLGWNPDYGGWHLGQDFARAQNLPVYAISDGEVVESRTDVGGYGPIDPVTGNPTPGGALVARFRTATGEYFTALYGHLNNPHLEGTINAGEVLGYINEYNPSHLHFGIHLGYDIPANPWRGYTYDSGNTYGFVDPIEWITTKIPFRLRVPVDVVLVIDRSGSMEGTKIANAKTAAKQFVDLMQMSDKIGVVSFSSSAGVDFPLTEIAQSSGQPPQRLFFDDMESGSGNWSVQSPWGLTTSTYYSPTHCWTDSPGGNYSNYANTSLILNQSMSLPTGKGAVLKFKTKYALESGYDYGRIEVSADSGPWTEIASVNGHQNTWTELSVILSQFAGQSLRIRFRLTTDSSVTYDGWYIDDVEILSGDFDTKQSAKSAIDRISAGGMTAMGDGLRTAYNQLVTYGDPSRPWVIVLMSNGWHNYGTEHPYSVIPDLQSEDIRVYTIGLGADAESTLLGKIASDTGGLYRFAPTSADLLAIYNDIAARVAQAQSIGSASGLIAQGETTHLSIDIDSSITQATFTLSWAGSDLDLTLIRPDDTIIDPDVAAIDPNIEYIEEARYEIYRVNNPMAGTWQMVITAIDVPPTGENFTAQVTGITDVTLSLATDKDSYTYPEPVKIMVTLQDAGNPLTGANIEVVVTRPDSSQISITLFDDGLDIHGDAIADDGVYSNYFTQFGEDGSYSIKAVATGATLTGENFSREGQKTVLVSGVPFDTTPPATTLFIGSPQYVDLPGNLYVTSVTPFTLSTVDNGGGGSGVASTTYRIYSPSYDSGWITYVAPFNLTGFDNGTYWIDYYSADNAGNLEAINTATVILDNTGPSVSILNPLSGSALQDGVIYTASATDSGCGVARLDFSIREADGAAGIPVGFENLPATYETSSDRWILLFDTLLLPDGYYLTLAKAEDNLGNTGTAIVPYSIRNWAVVKLLPASESNKAGRTMPIKFSLRIVKSVDPAQPFVYNEQLEIRIYKSTAPSVILQRSRFGTGSTDYRIDTIGEKYITNFKTSTTPTTYVVEVWRTAKNFKIGSFTFKTVK